MPRHSVTLLTRQGCSLCDDVRAVLQRICAEFGASLQERDIADSPEESARWADYVPVTMIDGQVHDYWRVREDRLRAALSS